MADEHGPHDVFAHVEENWNALFAASPSAELEIVYDVAAAMETGLRRPTDRHFKLNINHLPSDVLQHIFEQLDERPDSDELTRPTYRTNESVAYAWLPITAVCRRWYQEGTDCSLLWSRIAVPGIPSVAFLHLCLTRSKQRALFVDCCNTSALATITLNALVQEAHRIAVLCLRCEREILQTFVSRLVTSNPNIRICSIKPAEYMRNYQGSLLARCPPLPGLWTGLESLAISAPFRISWDRLGRCSRLKHLVIHNEDAVPSAQELFMCLASLLELQTLEVHARDATLYHARLPTFTMPFLWKLDVHAPLEVCTAFAQHINTPFAKSVSLRYSDIAGDVDPHTIASPMARMLSSLRATELPDSLCLSAKDGSCSVQASGCSVRTFTAANGTVKFEVTRWRPELLLEFNQSLCTGNFLNVLKYLPVRWVTSLFLGSTIQSPNALAILEEQMPDVYYLCLTVMDNEDADSTTVVHPELSSHPSVWPALKLLVVQCGRATYPLDALWLHDILQTRRAAGCSTLLELDIRSRWYWDDAQCKAGHTALLAPLVKKLGLQS